MANIRTTSLQNHLRRATKNPHAHISIVPSDDIGVWYFIMGIRADAGANNEGEFFGKDDEFAGGQYLGELVASKEYPYGPPDAKMKTPNGIFPLDSADFCIDIGKYHGNNYPASLGLDGFAAMIWAGLLNWRELGRGIALFPNGDPKKDISIITKPALASRAYNQKHHKAIIQIFIDVQLERGLKKLAIVKDAAAPAPVEKPLSAKELRIKQQREALAARRAAAEQKEKEDA